jgi:cation efflux system membrane fusion protein
MKPFWIASSILAVSLAMSTPNLVLAHEGHGNEFQAEGGINRVQVNPETDSLLGIEVTPIESAVNGSATVLIPVTALVDANGQELVFVQYENFYEPVPITTGATQGELVEVIGGLSVGEQLVTQGGLSLYAESRKTQAPTTADATHAQVDAQGIPHSHDASGNLVQSNEVGETAVESAGLPLGKLALGGGVMLLLASGAIALSSGGSKKKRTFSNRRGSN